MATKVYVAHFCGALYFRLYFYAFFDRRNERLSPALNFYFYRRGVFFKSQRRTTQTATDVILPVGRNF